MQQTSTQFRHRYFSSMTYQQHEDYFGPRKPILKPSADPEILDDFELNPEIEYAGINSGQVISTLEGEYHNGVGLLSSWEYMDSIRLNGSFNRQRSQSDNSIYLIFTFLEKQGKACRKRVKMEE